MIGTLDYADLEKVRARVSKFSLFEPFKPWPYAKLVFGNHGLAMRLERNTYYRDNGAWGIVFEIRDERIFARSTYKEVDHLDGREFFEISKEEWAKENGDGDE